VLQREIHGRLEVTDLRAAVVAPALEFVGVHVLLAQQPADAVGELDLAARARARVLEEMEDARRKDVAADDSQRRGRFLGFGLLHHRGDLRDPLRDFLRGDDAVRRRVLARDVLDRDHAAAVLRVHLHHLLHHRRRRVDEVVGEDHGERLVAHEVARAEHGVAQAERLGLPHIRAGHARGQEPAHFLQQLRLAVRLQLGLELVGLVEMVLDGALAAAGDEDEVGDAGVHRFFHRVLDERLVDDGQHLLGRSLGGRQESRAQPRHGKDGFGDFGHLISFRNCSSSRTFTPSSWALSSFEPASVPATT
jgi:hypothetical protein